MKEQYESIEKTHGRNSNGVFLVRSGVTRENGCRGINGQKHNRRGYNGFAERICRGRENERCVDAIAPLLKQFFGVK